MLFVRWMMNGLNMTKNVICGVLESLRKFKTQLMISVCDALFSVSHDIKSEGTQTHSRVRLLTTFSVTHCSLVDRRLRDSVTPSVAGMRVNPVTSVRTPSLPPFNRAN